MNNLPTISATQAWCCANGCGECKQKEAEHEYYRQEDLQGNLIESKTEVIHVSHCCRADLLLWDQDKQNFVEWSYVEPDGPTAEGAA